MAHEFRVTRRVDFADTDAAGVVHFSSFFRYMEDAEHAFYRSLGGAAFIWTPEGIAGMPRVSVRCDYRQPLHYGEEVEVHLIVREKTSRRLCYEVVFCRAAPAPAIEIARGEMTVVFAARTHSERDWAATTLPTVLAEQIEAAPGTGEA